jgi:mono/diheme cytochrome c family protein
MKGEARTVVVVLVLVLVLVGAAGGDARASTGSEPRKIFNQRCTACHTFGKGVKVGPDLKGIAQRRPRPWLLKFIRSSQAMIQAQDPTATTLFQQYGRQRMPDWMDLSEAQIGAIVDWLAASGPEQKEPDERHAELASAADLDRGRALVEGTVRLAHGGLACATCHSVTAAAGARGGRGGGTLGPDLGDVYSRYQDRALTLFLKTPCSPRMPELATSRYLTPEESFAIKAYLRHAALSPPATLPSNPRRTGSP